MVTSSVEGIRVLVAGPQRRLEVGKWLARLHQVLEVEAVVQDGSSGGAAEEARLWAEAAGVEIQTYPVDPEHGPAGCSICHTVMLRRGRPNLVVMDGLVPDLRRRALGAGVRMIGSPHRVLPDPALLVPDPRCRPPAEALAARAG